MHEGTALSFGERITISSSGSDQTRNSMLTPAQAMQWSIFVAEARRIAGRPDTELSPLGMALRAFTLLLKYDSSFFKRIDFLLNDAEGFEKDDGAIALIDAMYCYIRFQMNGVRKQTLSLPGVCVVSGLRPRFCRIRTQLKSCWLRI